MNTHHVPLVAGFSLWKWFALRGAGFNIERIESLACSAYAAEVDRWLARAQSFETTLAERAPLSAARERRWIERAIEAVRSHKIPLAPTPGVVNEEVVAQLDGLRRARETLVQQHLDESARVGRFLRDAVKDPLFREAVIWQNRHALHTGLDVLSHATSDHSNGKMRKKEQLVVSYLQRYCTKNDSIGFFGPMGFGTFRRDVAGTSSRPGPSLLAHRQVYFEHWCIVALASKLSEDPRIKRWIAPRLVPTLRIEGHVVHHPEGSTDVPEAFARALLACDGHRTAVDIARTLLEDEAAGFSEEDEVLEALEQLEEQGLVYWRLAIPGDRREGPESWLRRALLRIGDLDLRAEVLGHLTQLDVARAAVASAAGDPVALDAAAASFEATFVKITGTDATRNAGQTYGGRTLFYEDCRRDLDLEIGTRVLDQLAPALGLVLQSARWYTDAIGRRYRLAFAELYEQLRVEQGTSVIEYVRFMERADSLFGTLRTPHLFVSEIVSQLQTHWRDLLSFDNGESRVARRSTELAQRAASAFQAAGPGWPGARFHSPDIQISARSIDAIENGDYVVVLGELHPGLNTLPPLLHLHADPAPLIEAFEHDLRDPRVDIVSRARAESRADAASPSRRDFDIEIGSTQSHRQRDHVIAIGQLVVDVRDGQPIVRTRDGAHVFDIIAFHERQIATGALAQFRMLTPANHLPRITIDSLVISREQWTFLPATIPFASEDSGEERFVGARHWARLHGLPRYVFYKIPEETKPVFLDLECPSLIEIFARQVRKASRVFVSEMLPSVDELWLTDAEQRTYTSEIRAVAVDAIPWSAR